MKRCLLILAVSSLVGLTACAEPEPVAEPVHVADPQWVVGLAPSIPKSPGVATIPRPK